MRRMHYIAFLRAINVGGHTVKMERLRGLFAELGLARVESFIASGNVIFEAPVAATEALEQQIAQHLQQSLGYAVATFLRTTAEVAAITRYQPFEQAAVEQAHALHVGFVGLTPGEAAQHRLLTLATANDDFHSHGREVYWLSHQRISDSTLSGATLEKALGLPMTMRNITTIRKLAAKYPPSKRPA
jgi:uncharacterized protein (DUF1697 family)